MLTPLLTIVVVNSGVVRNMLLYPGFKSTEKKEVEEIIDCTTGICGL